MRNLLNVVSRFGKYRELTDAQYRENAIPLTITDAGRSTERHLLLPLRKNRL